MPVKKPLGACLISRETVEADLGIVLAETWPARYKFHKYWGRKPANVVSRYIEFFTDANAVVLDPFIGSGVTVIEAERLGRRSIGFDVNPVAARLTEAMLSPPDAEAFSFAAKEILRRAQARGGELYVSLCDKCGGKATLRSAGYIGEEMVEVRYNCHSCGYSGARQPSSDDLSRLEIVPKEFDFPDADIVFGWEMQKLKRKGVKRWSELFTRRNLYAASCLRQEIMQIDDDRVKQWLLLTLTAALAQFTKMMADSSGAAGGPSWKINCYWLPKAWQELNPFRYFENRVSKSRAAVNDLLGFVPISPKGTVSFADSRRMAVADEGVDYIFTDPPYGGEGIQYGELSVLWCLWLGEQQHLQSEIAFNPYRKFNHAHYAKGLKDVFAECFRVLKVGKYMTVAFANKDPDIWAALMDACRRAGFALVAVVPMKRSAPSLTETNMFSAPKADLLITFQKPDASLQITQYREVEVSAYDLSGAVKKVFSLSSENANISVHEIFDRVTIDWLTWFYEGGEPRSSARPTLANVESELNLVVRSKVSL